METFNKYYYEFDYLVKLHLNGIPSVKFNYSYLKWRS